MKIITYSLKDINNSSDNYYNCIGIFTEMVIGKAKEFTEKSIKDFRSYSIETGHQSVSSWRESIVDALTLGVLWKAYGNTVICLNPMFRGVLAAISKNRSKYYHLKRGLDSIKGVLITLTLSHPLLHKHKLDIPDITQVKELLSWLEAFGDFEQEVKRLKRWVDFMSTTSISNNSIPNYTVPNNTVPNNSISDKHNYLKDLIEFADWFEVEAQKRLGKYTYNVDNFLKEKQSLYRWREDRIFCFRKPIEYHLNMVGAQILSMEYREDFENSHKNKVLLPVCMRSRPEGKCMAKPQALGSVCAKCTPECIVNTITSLGDKNGYEVYMISHESSAFSAEDMGGIVGVSCVTRLIEGGWKAKELGLPPQCVVLDYCGCKNHWDDNGIPTTLNISELNKIMQNSTQRAPQK